MQNILRDKQTSGGRKRNSNITLATGRKMPHDDPFTPPAPVPPSEHPIPNPSKPELTSSHPACNCSWSFLLQSPSIQNLPTDSRTGSRWPHLALPAEPKLQLLFPAGEFRTPRRSCHTWQKPQSMERGREKGKEDLTQTADSWQPQTEQHFRRINIPRVSGNTWKCSQ